MALTDPSTIITSIRRMTGDLDADNYRISTRDMYYYLQDAVDEVQIDHNFGYELTLTTTTASWNQTLYSSPFVLFKLKALIFIMESSLHDNLWYSGNVQIGDIKIDINQTLKIRMENLKRLKEDYKRLMQTYQMNDAASGVLIDTYVTGLINNDLTEYLTYEPIYD